MEEVSLTSQVLCERELRQPDLTVQQPLLPLPLSGPLEKEHALNHVPLSPALGNQHSLCMELNTWYLSHNDMCCRSRSDHVITSHRHARS